MGGVVGGLVGGLTNSFIGSAGLNQAGVNSPVTTQQLQDAAAQQQAALAQQNALVQALQGANGVGNQSAVFNQLQGVANGTGPNPAQAMLAQATGANVANQAALMAGQRGAASNVGLMARQAAQQGANAQQQAIGQGATLQANQSLGALGQMGGIAGQQVGEQQNAISGANSAALQNQANLLGIQNQANQMTLQTQAANRATQAQIIGGLMGGLGSAAQMIPGASNPAKGMSMAGGPMDAGGAAESGAMLAAEGGEIESGPQSMYGKMMAQGGKVPVLLSPGEKVLTPQQALEAAKGKASPMKEGKKVPGKPAVGGAKNDYANDTVPDKLAAGSVVLPRSVTQSKDADEKARAFVAAIMAKKGKL